MKTKTIFRKFPDNDVIALFPDVSVDFDSNNCLSYMHVGQHGVASKDLISDLQPASEQEYADLQTELESIGYRLEIVK